MGTSVLRIAAFVGAGVAVVGVAVVGVAVLYWQYALLALLPPSWRMGLIVGAGIWSVLVTITMTLWERMHRVEGAQ